MIELTLESGAKIIFHAGIIKYFKENKSGYDNMTYSNHKKAKSVVMLAGDEEIYVLETIEEILGRLVGGDKE